MGREDVKAVVVTGIDQSSFSLLYILHSEGLKCWDNFFLEQVQKAFSVGALMLLALVDKNAGKVYYLHVCFILY